MVADIRLRHCSASVPNGRAKSDFMGTVPRSATSCPGSNQEFWDTKIANNRQRDRHVSRELRRLGWTVVRVWQHQLDKPARAVGRVVRALELV